jgi:hypothetical protein
MSARLTALTETVKVRADQDMRSKESSVGGLGGREQRVKIKIAVKGGSKMKSKR